MKIAIIGAKGNIGQGITPLLAQDNELCLFARSMNNLDEFPMSHYDAVINCSHPGTDNMVFKIAEFYDNLIFSYLKHNSDSIVISLSSGVAGRIISAGYSEKDNYAIAKLNSEAKHRASSYNIIDLRLFSYFNRTCRLTDTYFITAIIRSILYGEPFETDIRNFTRDYLSAYDLTSLINKCLKYGKNAIFEAYSVEPTSKLAILEAFKREVGLSYHLREIDIKEPATGYKTEYIPTDRSAENIGYHPTITSMDNLIAETKAALKIQK